MTSPVKKADRRAVEARPAITPSYEEELTPSSMASIANPQSKNAPPEVGADEPDEAPSDQPDDLSAVENDVGEEVDQPLYTDLGVQDVKAIDIDEDPELASISSVKVLDKGMTDENRELRDQLRQHGLLNPVVLRKKGNRYDLVDGYRVFPFCKELNIPIRGRILEFADDDAVLEYRVQMKLGRQAVTKTERDYLIGKRFLLTDKRQGERTDLKTSGQSARKLPAEWLGEIYGYDERTVRRKGVFTRAVDKLADHNPLFRRLVLAEQIKGMSQAEAERLAIGAVDREQIDRIVANKKHTPPVRVQTKDKRPILPLVTLWQEADRATRKTFLLGVFDDPLDQEILKGLGITISKKE